ncbi:PLDc N-terminal domain-containing protein [Winogradskyella vidalii]|uniref:PLDc N-terminal domain-containing protein n=1 Tax=Winogradskyella vidalii TaxID=2615024 RepID=UPI0015CE3A25|nr:PLDc N-terminal domain-containing protein [Winogradskyella vidalii]
MKNNKPIHISFISALLFSIIGTLLKINQYSDFANSFLVLGLILTFIFIILSVIEISKSKKLSPREKMLWTIGLIVFLNIGTIIYYFIGRKRI